MNNVIVETKIRVKPKIAPRIPVPSISPNSQIEKTTIYNDTYTNKGSGAGGAYTNMYGKRFEDKTSNYTRLIDLGYVRYPLIKSPNKPYHYHLSRTFEDMTITFVLQSGLKKYLIDKYNIEISRHPDEAYIIEYKSGKTIIKILEKKEQYRDGSVEEKLLAGIGMKQIYEIQLGSDIEVKYGYCVNEFLKNKLLSDKKDYKLWIPILKKNNIDVLFGDY